MNKSYHISPHKQGLLVLGLFGITLLYLFLTISKEQEHPDLRSYLYAGSYLLFYIIMNSFFSFGANDRIAYYRNSIFTYIFLLIAFVVTCQLISKVHLHDAKSYSWLFYVFSLVYIVFMTIISLIRKIVDIAVNQDNKLRNEL